MKKTIAILIVLMVTNAFAGMETLGRKSVIKTDLQLCSNEIDYRSCQEAVSEAKDFGMTETEIILLLAEKFRNEISSLRVRSSATANGYSLSSEQIQTTINQHVDKQVKIAMSRN